MLDDTRICYTITLIGIANIITREKIARRKYTTDQNHCFQNTSIKIKRAV